MATYRVADEVPLRMRFEDADGQWSVVVMVPKPHVGGNSALSLMAHVINQCAQIGMTARRAARVATSVNFACCFPRVPERDIRRLVGYAYGGDRGWLW